MRPLSFLVSALSVALSASACPSDDAPKPKAKPHANSGSAKRKSTTSKVDGPSLYVVGYSHLDTEWCWNYPQVIREFVPNTLHDNFSLFEKYPDYVFNWTGANRYRFMKEYYPDDYARLKSYVAAGRWFPNGSSLEELDVNNPDSESILRQVLYGNQFFRHEFGKAGVDFILPDCFGFPASLPSILHHAGVKGFSTQKLTWGSAVGIPFNLGVWKGPDGQGVVSALNAGDYGSNIDDNLSNDNYWVKRVNQDAIKVDYRYYGAGDRGGSPSEGSVKNLEASLHGSGPLKVIGGPADQIFKDITPAQVKKLPVYQGDLELTQHSAGSLTSESEMKRWNHKNELLADAAEKSSTFAAWVGALPYDHSRLTDAWMRFLPGQFHDLMAGTALPKSYNYAWNDQAIAANEFSGVLAQSVGAVARAMDARSGGVPVVVYNPLSTSREDVVEATVNFPGPVPQSLVVADPRGRFSPVQIKSRSGHQAKVLFLAKLPSVGYGVFDLRAGRIQAKFADSLRVATTADLPGMIENSRYRVTLNADGDIDRIYDKVALKDMLSAPSRLAYVHHNPNEYPAWNMDWRDAQKPPRAYVGHVTAIKVVENGPVRVALEVTRESEGSKFVETIRLANGAAANRVEIGQSIDWRGQESALKATFPLSVSNPKATYNWGMGAIQRGNNDPRKYEVASHDWFDLTDTSGQYGVTVLSGLKFGSDKPSDSELRLTLLYTPGVNGGYQHQATQDWGHHDFWYGLAGHIGNWNNAATEWEALRLNQPLLAFQTKPHFGKLPRSVSVAAVTNHNVSITALKKAEDSNEVVVRLQEMGGKASPNTVVRFASKIVSAREINGQEQTIGSAKLLDGQLVYDAAPYAPRAFAVRLAEAPSAVKVSPVTAKPLALPFNLDGTSTFKHPKDGNFDGSGNTLPGELLPKTITANGVVFALGKVGRGVKNVVVPKGQTLILPAGNDRTLYILGASVKGDQTARFNFGSASFPARFQAWDGYIGQWDNRLWDGPQPDLTYSWDLHLAGLVHGYVKPESVAWYADHKRLASGVNDPYNFCYLFATKVSVPNGATTVVLPKNASLRILAMTVAQNANEATQPAQPLFDTLPRPTGDAPSISPASGSYSDSLEVKLEQPLFWNAKQPLHYTLDGSTPTANAPTYSSPLWITRDTTIKAAQVDDSGKVGPVATAQIQVHDITAPKVVSATAIPSAPLARIEFSERLDKASAEDASHYQVDGATVESAKVSADGKTVSLKLAAPLTSAAQLTISNVTDQAETPNKVSDAPQTLEILKPVFEAAEPEAFAGAGRGKTSRVAGLPVQADQPWTINQFVYADEAPKDLTLISGFGDGRDRNGAERYLICEGTHMFFWGSNIDVDSGEGFDLNQWQMITISYDGKSIRIYKNGRLLKTEPQHLANASSMVRFAPSDAWGNGHLFKGKIAGFSVWNVALPPESVAALQSGKPH
jgi:alpha-mannosidase